MTPTPPLLLATIGALLVVAGAVLIVATGLAWQAALSERVSVACWRRR